MRCCSGNTPEHPGLLQYACRLVANVRPIAAAQVDAKSSGDADDLEAMAGILSGRPILALSFNNMEVSALHEGLSYNQCQTPRCCTSCTGPPHCHCYTYPCTVESSCYNAAASACQSPSYTRQHIRLIQNNMQTFKMLLVVQMRVHEPAPFLLKTTAHSSNQLAPVV